MACSRPEFTFTFLSYYGFYSSVSGENLTCFYLIRSSSVSSSDNLHQFPVQCLYGHVKYVCILNYISGTLNVKISFIPGHYKNTCALSLTGSPVITMTTLCAE
jgi:hypothetical protein